MNKLTSTSIKILYKHKALSSILALLWVFSFSACTDQSEPNIISTVIPAREAEVIQKDDIGLSTPTYSSNISPSSTPNNIIIIETPTLTPTSSKTDVPTPLLVSTLSVEQKLLLETRALLLQKLMETDENCQLPCWWGVELEESLENTEKIFINYDINILYTPSDFDDIDGQRYVHLGYYNYATFTDDVSVDVKFYPVERNIQFIDVSVERPLRQYGEEKLVQNWEEYSISSMLQKYGKPQYVYLFPQTVADPGPLNFYLRLYYPELGFAFGYEPYDISSSETQVGLCLGLENIASINLALYNPDFVNLRSNYLLPPALNPEAEGFIQASTWEVVTGMDLDMFYELYKVSNPECIQITP